MPEFIVSNSSARRLFLARHGLSEPLRARLSQAALAEKVHALGFVQIDSISTVERAHHMILHARNHTYRQHQLARLHEREAGVFENWTHDASLIPTAFYPYWQRAFERRKAKLHGHFNRWQGGEFQGRIKHVLDQIAANGPMLARDFEDKPDKDKDRWGWNWHPSKTALEYLWRTGGLVVARREGFQKVYDLPERVIRDHGALAAVSDADLVDWACSAALDRLGFATPAELAAFWDIITLEEAKAWAAAQPQQRLTRALVEAAEKDAKPRDVLLRPETLEILQNGDFPSPPGALRVLSPFDPAIRDRRRAQHLFGFDYRIEIFVPAAQRQYGYYVFPLLEGDRLIGRIDMKCDRNAGVLDVQGLWLEPRLQLTPKRKSKLEQALAAVAEFAGADAVRFADGFLKER
jgi:uncharacterized protein YcaQ